MLLQVLWVAGENGRRNLSLVFVISGSFNGNKGLKNEITKIKINKIPPKSANLFLEINLKKLII